MVRSLVFHLGDRKTGSTSIQNALAAGAVSCATRSLLYPTRNNHVLLARGFFDPRSRRGADERWDNLRRRLEASDADVAVISAEGFEAVNPALLRDTIETHLPGCLERSRFISYVRPHAERVVSSWAQQVKLGTFGGELQELHARARDIRRFVYTPRFRAWREVFGDRYTLRPMIRDLLKDRDVVRDFLDFVFEGAAFEVAPRPRSNETPCLEDLALLRAFHANLHKHVGATAQRELAETQLVKLLLDAPPRSRETRPALHRALAEEIVALYREDAAALDAEFFEGTPMSTALEAAPAKAVADPQSLELEAHLSPAEIRLARTLIRFVTHLAAADRTAAKPARHNRRRQAMLATAGAAVPHSDR